MYHRCSMCLEKNFSWNFQDFVKHLVKRHIIVKRPPKTKHNTCSQGIWKTREVIIWYISCAYQRIISKNPSTWQWATRGSFRLIIMDSKKSPVINSSQKRRPKTINETPQVGLHHVPLLNCLRLFAGSRIRCIWIRWFFDAWESPEKKQQGPSKDVVT